MINMIDGTDEEIIKKEILNLFVNESTRITHLYVPRRFDYQIHIIPGAERCFSELEFLSCNTSINDNVLIGLTEMCKSIKELELFIEEVNNNYGIVKLIETSKNLFNIRFLTKDYYSNNDGSFRKILENSLIKHSNTIRHFKITIPPITNILSSFVNLNVLELSSSTIRNWNCLENLSLPFLQILKAKTVPIKGLASLIENTNGYLIEIGIDFIDHSVIDNKRIIQSIYQNCPNLKYLKLTFIDSNNLELEKLLINCQYLNGLYIIIYTTIFSLDDYAYIFDWDYLFEVLTKSSPTNLFRFKFNFYEAPGLESLKLFLDNWKGRHSMLLQTIKRDIWNDQQNWSPKEYFDLIEKYKTQQIVKKYCHFFYVDTFEDFEWN